MRTTMKIAATFVAASLLTGCATYTNIPGIPGDVASHSPNASGVPDVMARAIQAVADDLPFEGPYAFELPEGVTPETHSRVLMLLDDRAVAESTPQTPVFKVAQVYLRGWYGQVDVIRPENPADGPAKSPNVEQVVTAKLRYEPFAGWRVRDLRLWRVPIAEALVLSTRSAEQSISE